MKLIININEQDFNYANNGSNYPMDISTKNRILSAIRNGKPYEERPQGEWIRTGSLGNGNAQYECSNCHYGDEQAESQEVPYCWHCGAKLIKGKKAGVEE